MGVCGSSSPCAKSGSSAAGGQRRPTRHFDSRAGGCSADLRGSSLDEVRQIVSEGNGPSKKSTANKDAAAEASEQRPEGSSQRRESRTRPGQSSKGSFSDAE